jgi:hypothetical protein
VSQILIYALFFLQRHNDVNDVSLVITDRLAFANLFNNTSFQETTRLHLLLTLQGVDQLTKS